MFVSSVSGITELWKMEKGASRYGSHLGYPSEELLHIIILGAENFSKFILSFLEYQISKPSCAILRHIF